MLKSIRRLTPVLFFAIVFVLLLGLVFDFGSNISGQGGTPEALSVEGRPVTFARLDEIAQAQAEAMRSEGVIPEAEIPHAAFTRAVEDMTDHLVVLALAKRIGTEASAAEVVRQVGLQFASGGEGVVDQNKFDELRKQVPASQWRPHEENAREQITYMKTFLFLTQGVGVTEAMLRGHYQGRYARARLRQILVRPSDFVTDSAARAFYEAHPDSFLQPERATFRAVVFAPASQDPQDAILARERAIRASLRLSGAGDFDRLYANAEEDTDGATRGQQFEEIPRTSLGEFETTVWMGPLGVPTQVLSAGEGKWAILMTDRRFPRGALPFDKASKSIRTALAGDSEWARARERAYEIAASPDSAALLAAGEDLGWVTLGEIRAEDFTDTRQRERILEDLAVRVRDRMGNTGLAIDPAVEGAVRALSAGGATGVLRTSHGFHLLRLEGRSPADPDAFEARKGALRETLLAALREEAFRSLIRQARSTVDIQRSDYLLERLSPEEK